MPFDMSEVLSSITGRKLLESSQQLQAVVHEFQTSATPERTINGRYIGGGRYSHIWEVEGVVVKLSSPTANRDSIQSGKPTKPEDLLEQFDFLGRLGEHLAQQPDEIIVPRQYFALCSQFGAYLLCQQYMAGWVSAQDWIGKRYGYDLTDDQKQEIKTLVVTTKQRIVKAIGTSPLMSGLNDLKLDKPGGLHGGNVLFPSDAPSSLELPVCIIDQPGVQKVKLI